MDEHIKINKQGIILSVHAQPGSHKSGLSGIHGGRVKVRLAAKAVDGAANESLCAFLSQVLDVPKSSITLLSGHKSRFKLVLIQGNPPTLAALLARLLNEVPGI